VFRVACAITGRKLFVNIDGVEWRRKKFGIGKRALLWVFDYLAQKFSHHIIYDNEALFDFLVPSAKLKASCIAYPGDHVERLPGIPKDSGAALTICRIEPENNLEVLIEGFLDSKLSKYTIVGNWDYSEYSRNLRRRYINEKRLLLVDPVYDSRILAQLRESCQFYLHGHSVGGTNPSLVEMIFYDCAIFCYDVNFNRNTAKDCANYFRDPHSLSELLNGGISVDSSKRLLMRELYNAKLISSQYLAIAQKS
jgi:glycosyltransferase involved in cell wall biosynthesis